MKIPAFLMFALSLGAAAAHAELVLVSSPGTALTSLTQAQVSRLFFGMTDLLPNGGKAVPMDVNGAVKDEFARTVLKKSPAQVEKYWARMIFTGKAKPPREVKAEDIKAAIARTPGAISYLDRSQVDGSVQVIAITP